MVKRAQEMPGTQSFFHHRISQIPDGWCLHTCNVQTLVRILMRFRVFPQTTCTYIWARKVTCRSAKRRLFLISVVLQLTSFAKYLVPRLVSFIRNIQQPRPRHASNADRIWTPSGFRLHSNFPWAVLSSDSPLPGVQAFTIDLPCRVHLERFYEILVAADSPVDLQCNRSVQQLMLQFLADVEHWNTLTSARRSTCAVNHNRF